MNKISDYSKLRYTTPPIGTEVFVGGLPHTITEERIREIFSSCGEILEIIKNKKDNLKGFCFVHFATKEAANKAVKEYSGYEVDGKAIGVLPSIKQDTLFIGNLNKGWNAEKFESIVRQVFQDVESVELHMNKDVKSDENNLNRGFGFVKFSSYIAARHALRASSLSDFIFGDTVHPCVKWAELESGFIPSELTKIKIGFIRNIPISINEEYLRKLFEPFGKVDKIVLSKKSDIQIGFIHFDKREDLENAIKEMGGKIVGPDEGSRFKIQIEVARPMEKKRKRTNEDSFSMEMKFGDSYEDAVISLPKAIKDRILHILRCGIASRFDIDIGNLAKLRELPESTGVYILDQFIASGFKVQEKGVYLSELIDRNHHVRGPTLSSFSNRTLLPHLPSNLIHGNGPNGLSRGPPHSNQAPSPDGTRSRIERLIALAAHDNNVGLTESPHAPLQTIQTTSTTSNLIHGPGPNGLIKVPPHSNQAPSPDGTRSRIQRLIALAANDNNVGLTESTHAPLQTIQTTSTTSNLIHGNGPNGLSRARPYSNQAPSPDGTRTRIERLIALAAYDNNVGVASSNVPQFPPPTTQGYNCQPQNYASRGYNPFTGEPIHRI